MGETKPGAHIPPWERKMLVTVKGFLADYLKKEPAERVRRHRELREFIDAAAHLPQAVPAKRPKRRRRA